MATMNQALKLMEKLQAQESERAEVLNAFRHLKS